MLALKIGGSGTSDVVRFMSNKDERITIVIGIDNYERWCYIVTGPEPKDTALLINGQYYNNGGRDYIGRDSWASTASPALLERMLGSTTRPLRATTSGPTSSLDK